MIYKQGFLNNEGYSKSGQFTDAVFSARQALKLIEISWVLLL
jgi:hypothetical protein